MYPDQLYQLAFAFRKTKLWKALYESELFAVALPDGEIGYCSVMGFGGEHLALALYVGNKGLDSFRLLQKAGEMHPLKAYESMLSQDCLQCSFEGKDTLSPQELSAVRDYTSRNRISIRGANAFPPSHPPVACFGAGGYPTALRRSAGRTGGQRTGEGRGEAPAWVSGGACI